MCLNLAIQQQAGGNDQEAYTIYSQIVKNKQCAQRAGDGPVASLGCREIAVLRDGNS